MKVTKKSTKAAAGKPADPQHVDHRAGRKVDDIPDPVLFDPEACALAADIEMCITRDAKADLLVREIDVVGQTMDVLSEAVDDVRLGELDESDGLGVLYDLNNIGEAARQFRITLNEHAHRRDAEDDRDGAVGTEDALRVLSWELEEVAKAMHHLRTYAFLTKREELGRESVPIPFSTIAEIEDHVRAIRERLSEQPKSPVGVAQDALGEEEK